MLYIFVITCSSVVAKKLVDFSNTVHMVTATEPSLLCRRRKSNAAGNKKDVTADSNKDCTNTFRNLALAASPVTGCKAANTLAALAQQAPSTDALLQSLCDSRRNSLALNSSQLLEAEHRQTSSASDQSLVSQPNFRQLLQSAVEPTMTTQKQPPSQAYDSRLDLMLPADEKPLFQTHQAGPPAMTDELADDPLQDVLNWDLPEPTSTPFNTSSYNQAMAYMQDPQVTDQTPFQQQAPVQALYANPINSSSMLGVSPEGAYISSLTPQPYPGQSAQMPVMAAPQLNAPQQAYPSSFAAVRLSIKLFNSTPAQLPSNLRQQLTGWLNCAPASIEGYIRPGCVHLTMTAIMPSQASDAQPAPAHLRRVITQLLDTPQEHVWHNTTMLVQLGNEAAVVHQGQNLKAWSLAAPSGTPAAAAGSVQDPAAATAAAAVRAAAGTATEASINMPCCANLGGLPSRLSVLQCTQPACLIAGQQQLQSVRLEVQGWSRDCKVVCRAGGRHWEVQLRHLSAANQAGSYAIEVRCSSQPLLSCLSGILHDQF